MRGRSLEKGGKMKGEGRNLTPTVFFGQTTSNTQRGRNEQSILGKEKIKLRYSKRGNDNASGKMSIDGALVRLLTGKGKYEPTGSIELGEQGKGKRGMGPNAPRLMLRVAEKKEGQKGIPP